MGVSLDSHIADLKKRYPEARVQTRRDRDGFAIVKLSFRPEFKYDLDKILAMDPDELKKHEAETLEALLEISGSSDPKKIGPAQLNAIVSRMRGESPADDLKISNEHMLAIDKLARERAEGRFRDDVEGFKVAMQELNAEIEAS